MIRLPKPEKCCEMFSNEHEIPAVSKGERIDVDLCVSDIVAALNAGGIPTMNSCCGHGDGNGYIQLWDGRRLEIERETPQADEEEANGTATGTV
jgi:hypothetical protein